MEPRNVVRLEQHPGGRGQGAKTPQPATAADARAAQALHERAVLGASMLAPDVTRAMVEPLTVEHFVFAPHKLIWQARADVIAAGGPGDVVDVAAELLRTGRGKALPDGISYVHRLIGSVPAIQNLHWHVGKLVEGLAGRNLIAGAKRLIASVEGGDVLASDAARTFAAEAAELQRRVESDDEVDDYEAEGHLLYERHLGPRDAPAFLSTGFPDIDRAMPGLGPGAHLMLGARSESGKSTLALNIACNVAQAGHHVAFFGLEMTRREYYARILASESGVDEVAVLEQKFTPDQAEAVLAAANRVISMRLAVFEGVRRFERIQAITEALYRRGRLDLLIVDHIHLVQREGRYVNNYARSEDICMGLRNLASDLKCVVLTVAQFPSSTSKGRDKERPQMDWLKGGEFMYSVPSHILLLHNSDRTDPKVEAIVAKNRLGGKHAIVPLLLRPSIARFESWSSRQ